MTRLVIHGGAGKISPDRIGDKEPLYRAELEKALDIGHEILKNGGNSLDAVEKALNSLEDTPMFNAGTGAVYTAEGTHEMDASIMEGKGLEAGAVTGIKNVRNPISLARIILEKSPHVFLSGKGAEEYAKLMECKFEPDKYFHDEERLKSWNRIKGTDELALDFTDEKYGTVGAVALDEHGNLAAATSTGGMTNKRYGRVGDTAIIGSGTYANNKTCAVSSTGSGEYFIRGVIAYDISCLMEYKGLSLVEAADEVIHNRLQAIGGDGGVIAVDAKGNIALPFNTEGMFRGSISEAAKEIAMFK